jgi:hypothetical protein
VAATHGVPDLRVGSAEVARMQSAAAIVADCRDALAAGEGGIFDEIAAIGGRFADWQHYPVGEVYDPKSHAQFFYHTHPASARSSREHGHFHTFLRAEGMPLGVTPLVLPELALAAAPPSPQAAPLKHGVRAEVSHLVALALDSDGEPIRLFTTNRWVTGETWYRADDVIRMLDRFLLDDAAGSVLLNRWIGAVIALFRPQIAALLRVRDDTIMGWRRRRRTNVFEDTRIEITSSCEIDLNAQLAFLDRLRSEAGGRASAYPARLPPMGEGWGEEQTD